MEHEKMETRQERIAKLKKARAYERNSKWIGATLAVSLTAASVFVQPEEAKACDCAAPYTVKEGDTIYSLAKKFQVSVEQLKSKNGFASNDLYVGQQMIVPTLDENGRPLHLTLMEQKKDYLENNGVHKESNEKTEPSIKPEEIKTGSTPSGKSTEAPVAVAAMEKLDQTVTKVTPQQTKISGSFNHVVQSGDSLWKIANKYGTTVEKIRQDNQLKTDALQIGQKLIITPKGSTAKPGAGQKPTEQPKPPAPSGSTVTHTVQSGDSLWKIANKYGTTVEKIRQDNQLKTDALQIGQKLIITPKGSAAKPGAGQKPTEQPKPPAPSGSTVTHIVQSGDSLWKIANKYGTTVEKIRQDNRLKTDALKIGQKLIITPKGSAAKPGAGQKPTEQPKPPAPSGSTVTHIVQSGDSLWKIANKYGTTVEKIRQDNQLKTDALKIGQKLIIYKNKEQTNKKEPGKIPGQKITQKPKQASSTVNIVKNDDSLSILTKKTNISAENLTKSNQRTIVVSTVEQKNTMADGKVAAVKPPTVTYHIKPGDTLYSLAERFNTKVSALMQLNKLQYPVAIIGTSLQVPADHVKTSQGMIVGAIDNRSIEVLIDGSYQVLEVSYGSSESYSHEENQQVLLTYTTGSDGQRPALINVEKI